MIKSIFLEVSDRIGSRVPEFRWVDQDMGQIDVRQGERPQVAMPCSVVSVEFTDCSDIDSSGLNQACNGRIIVRMLWDKPMQRTATAYPTDKREADLDPYNTVGNMYLALQAMKSRLMSRVTRRSQRKVTRADGLFEYRMEFQFTADDETADV